MAQTDIELTISGRVEKLEASLKKAESQLDSLGKTSDKTKKKTESMFDDMLPKITKGTVALAAATAAFAVLSKGIDLAMKKQTALAEFSAITGVTGKALDEFGDSADRLAIKFGTSALDNITSFKGVLSRLGPDFASSAEAVELMGENINILAKASGLDAAQSMDALTTAMLQFGVDLADPLAAANDAAVMMNIMAAAAKEGAAEIPQISEALVQAGVTAKNLGVSFEETNAAIQTLATGGKFGAEAGVALRNVMASMTKVSELATDSLNRYGISTEELGAILTTKGINEAMKRLNQAMQEHGTVAEDASLMAALFGKENMASAQILAGNVDLTDKYTQSIQGTNTAQEQANKIMATQAERWNRITTKIDVYIEKIGAVLQPVIEGVMSVIDEFISKIESTADGFGKLFDGDFDGAWDSFTGKTKKAGDEVKKTATEMRKAKKDVDAVTNALEPGASKRKSGSGGARKEAAGYKDILRDLQRQYGGLADTAEGFIGPAFAEQFAVAIAPMKELNREMLSLSTVSADGVLTLQEDIPVLMGLFEGLADAGSEAFQSMGAAIAGEADALKGVFRTLLNTVITYVEGLILAAAAASAGKAVTSFGLSLITDAPLLAAAFAGLEIARGVVNSFEVGSPFIGRDQYARLHKGEAVLTADQNAERMKGMGATSAGSRVGPLKTSHTTIAVRPVMFDYSIDRNRMSTARRMS